jgi:hypothetical protein
MTHLNSKAVIQFLELITEPATKSQIKLANYLCAKLSKKLPKIVFAAELRSILKEDLFLTKSRLATKKEIAYAEKLAKCLHFSLKIGNSISKEILDSWIFYFWHQQNLRALKKLKLQPNDIVGIKDDHENASYIISSFSENGKIYFKGGKHKAWASNVVLKCRGNEKSTKHALEQTKAMNKITFLLSNNSWSYEKQIALNKYSVNEELDPIKIQRFKDELGKAKDEYPLQKTIEEFPSLLVSILTGSPKYLIPKPRFGSQYVPDFLIADVDSSGIRWILVEFETPMSSISIRNCKDFDQYARKGISQILEWREWLTNNLAYADRDIKQDGLGLTGIRPDCDGLLIIGKRSLIKSPLRALRNREWTSNKIRIRTYDGLIESSENLLRHGNHPLNDWFLYNDDKVT